MLDENKTYAATDVSDIVLYLEAPNFEYEIIAYVEGSSGEYFNEKKNLDLAINKLNLGGHLIILVPAHQKLFGKFDSAVGHYRRYNIDFFKLNKFENTKIEKIIYLDLFGYILYFFNKIFYKEEVYPSKLKIFLWDKIF